MPHSDLELFLLHPPALLQMFFYGPSTLVSDGRCWPSPLQKGIFVVPFCITTLGVTIVVTEQLMVLGHVRLSSWEVGVCIDSLCSNFWICNLAIPCLRRSFDSPKVILDSVGGPPRWITIEHHLISPLRLPLKVSRGRRRVFSSHLAPGPCSQPVLWTGQAVFVK